MAGRRPTSKSGRRNSSKLGKRPGSSSALDLTTLEGLYNLSQARGGTIAQKADEIVGKKKSIFSRVSTGMRRGLMKVLDLSQRTNYAVASAVKNTQDQDASTTFSQGLRTGITGQTKHTFTDVFSEMGFNPTTRTGKVTKAVAGFAFDVLLDPTTYITFGGGALAKVGVKGTERALSKAGMQLLKKGVAQGAGKEFGEQFVRDAIGRMAEKSPELYKKFIDQGGIKFFGNTIISGGRIAGVVQRIPGMSKFDNATKPIRNTLYALVKRDASATYGKLPREYVKLAQRYRDLGASRSDEAVNTVIEIAQANKLTSQEAELIANAIEHKLPLADSRLDNARQLIQRQLGRNLKNEQRAGIAVGDLPNYVPHILVDASAKSIPFKPTGVRTSLGASKGRTISKVVSEKGETSVGVGITERMGLKSTDVANARDQFGNKMTGDLYTDANGVVYRGADATISEINEAFGKEFFDPNIVNAAAIRGVASARAISSREFLDDVGRKFGAVAEQAPSGYVAVSAKELAGLKFHPAIAEQIEKMGKYFVGDEATNNLLKAFDKAQNLWKASVTSLFPAFHGRNAISNVFLNFLDIGTAAASPARHKLATQLMLMNAQAKKLERTFLTGGDAAKTADTRLRGLLGQPVLTDDFGKVWSFGDIRKEVKERRVAFGDEYTGFLDIRETVADKLKSATGSKVRKLNKINPLSQENVAFKAGRRVGNAIEQQARLLNFMTNLQKTGDVVLSAERTKQFLFDYTNLSDFEKNVMRRLIPFYTFTRKNLELQVTQLAKQPGKLAVQAKIVTSISKGMSGSQLSEDEWKALPNFLKEGLGIVINRDGDNVTIINSAGTPIESIFASLTPNAILGSLSPTIAVPMQVAIGKHFFFDKDLDDVNDATAYQNAPQFIKDYIGFTVRKNKDGSNRYVALNPTRLFILNNIPPSSRVVQTIGQLEAENVSGKLKVLRFITGLKPYGEDLELQEQIEEKKKIRALQDALEDAGVAPIFRRSFIPN